MATTDTTQMTPVEVDTVLYDNYVKQAQLQLRIVSQVKTIERYEAQLEKHDSDYVRTQVLDARNRLTEMQEERTALIAASTPYHVEYSRRPWNRYYLVNNTNGHVHRGMDCSTCFASTEYQWLVDLADCDEDAMIEEWGERACTVCFPTAPSNPNYNRPARVDREAREAAQAEKDARASAKAEKAITDVDGSPLKTHRDTYRTKVAARNGLSQAVQNAVWYGTPEYHADALQLAKALQAAGVDWLPAAERAFKKAVKEAKVPYDNPYNLSEERIAETQAEIAANIEATEALMVQLREVVA